MAFDVSKFLALTVLMAATGAACSGTDDKDDEPAGGSAGTSTSGKAGQGDGAGTDAGGNGNGGAETGNGGGGAAGGAPGAGAGGEALGGAGGAGGTPDIGECLGSLIVGGAGGAGPDVEPSLEGLCSDFYQTDCGDEDFAPSYNVCERVRDRAYPSVALAVAECITALSDTDECDDTKVAACFHALEGSGCANPDAAAACATIKERVGCEDIATAQCEKIVDLINPEMNDSLTGCMDPDNEGWYEESFTGTCVERLDRCAGVVL